MARPPIPTWFFALVVVRKGDRFLLIQEHHKGEPWYLPGGRVEPGESLVAAALRETLEEGGLRVRLDGILRIEHTPQPAGARVRVIFVGRPLDDTPPKSQADDESLGAGWFSLADLDKLRLRGHEVRGYCAEVMQGARVHPLSLLGVERRPPSRPEHTSRGAPRPQLSRELDRAAFDRAPLDRAAPERAPLGNVAPRTRT